MADQYVTLINLGDLAQVSAWHWFRAFLAISWGWALGTGIIAFGRAAFNGSLRAYLRREAIIERRLRGHG